MLKEIKWCFFDLGGTLVDKTAQEEFIVNTIVEEFARFGLIYDNRYIYSIMNKAAYNFFEPVKTTIHELSNTDEQYKIIKERVRFNHELAVLYPGVEEMLNILSSKYMLGVIANQSLGAEERLKKHNIHKYFSQFFLSAELGVSKPREEIFNIALNKTDCLPENAVMIGDKLENDIAPAKKLGMKTIRVLQGLSSVQIAKSDEYIPLITVHNVKDVVNYL